MTRLTVDARERIVRRMIEHRFAKEAAEISGRVADIANRLYDRRYGKNVELMESLPDGFLPSELYVHVQLPGAGYTRFDFNGWFDAVVKLDQKTLTRRCPYAEKGRPMSIDAKEKLAIEAAKVDQERCEFRVKVNKASREATRALSRFSTVASLLRDWPEAEPFVEKAEPSKNLPAVRTAELNALLDLPVSA